MGNLVTKLTTNNIELNESDVSDVIYSKQVAKSPAGQQTRTGLFRNIFNYDPRSPSTSIMRTPIAMFRSNSGGKFNHQELNESIESQVDLNILTPEEQDSLDGNGDLVKAAIVAEEELSDPRSPVGPELPELTRTPIVPIDGKTKKEDNLVKKLAEKLINIAIDDDKEPEIEKPKKSQTKNLIFEDEENLDRYSTPPKKASGLKDAFAQRTPLSSVGNSNTPKFASSTPKNSKLDNENQPRSVSRIPVSSRRLH